MLAGEAKRLLFYLVAIARISLIHNAASLVFSLIEIVRGGIAISNNVIGRYLQEIPEKCHPQFLKVPRKSKRLGYLMNTQYVWTLMKLLAWL